MPLHEFKCLQCGRKFEELIFSESEKVYCPDCSSEQVTKLVSAFASSGSKSAGGASCGSRGKFT